jgi:uncharacterized membrane protein
MTPMHDARLVVASPLPLVFLASSMSLFLGAVVSDAAYVRTYEIQWNNFAAWLLAGALVFAGVALAFALRDCLSARRRTRAALWHAVVLSAAWIMGFTASLTHARDAWASMPGGLVQSSVAFALILVSVVLASRRLSGAKR